jgi:hypothetical protein
MSDEQPQRTSLTEPMAFMEAPGNPPRYKHRTDKPVRYSPIEDKESGAILGYVWAGDEDDAAAYEYCVSGGARAANEGGFWFSRLRSAKARGLLPSQALAELAADQDTEGKGRPLPGSLAEAPNADVVKALAKCS